MISQNAEVNLRYVKIHFTLRYGQYCRVPANKASALRGGIGELLLRQYCVRDRQCENCDFHAECPVQRMMYSKPEIEPAFMGQGDSVGYIFSCGDYREEMQEGDETRLNLTLFGKSIVYFSQFLMALSSLGMKGYGKDNARFDIVAVTNSKGDDLLQNGSIYLKRLQIHTVDDYVEYRKKKLLTAVWNRSLLVQFQSPLSIKYQGEMMHSFQSDALIAALARRIYILNCYEGNEISQEEYRSGISFDLTTQECRKARVDRYSFRKGQKMSLPGIEGSVVLDNVSDEALTALLAGELIHIGKNTSFGFGRYRVMAHDE